MNTSENLLFSSMQILKPDIDKLIDQAKISLKEVEKVALDQAWKILQLATVSTIQTIENKMIGLPGKNKKTIAINLLSRFYDSVFLIVDIPLVPTVFESIIHKYVKTFLMILVGSTIDAMVITFRQNGIFHTNTSVDPPIDYVPKVSEK